MGKVTFLRYNLILKQSVYVRAHALANLHISLLSACTFDPLPEQSAAHHLQRTQPDEAALLLQKLLAFGIPISSQSRSQHRSVRGGLCKSEQGKDIACKKVRVRTQTDCTTSKEAISRVKAFSSLFSPTQGYLWVPVMHFPKNILFLPHLSPSTDKPPALQDEKEVLQGALKCLKCQITGLLSQIMSEIL